MKILVVTRANAPWNSIRPEMEVFIGLARRGHKVTLFTDGGSPYAARLREQGVEVVDQVPSGKICLATIRRIREALSRERYDILYALNSKAIPNAAFAAIGHPVKVITYRGTTGGLYRHDPSAYLTHLHPRVDGIICVSDAVRDDVIRRVWRKKVRENVITIRKGHDLSWYQDPPADLSEFGIKPDDFVLICAANARPSKGIPVLLEACSHLADLPDLHLILAGRNMEQYQPQIDASPMAERIHLAGFRTDAPALIAACDLLIQPSTSGEGLPRAVMEAMAYGTPPIITTTGGGKEVVEDGESGSIVPTGDSAAIAREVRNLYQNRDVVKKMSERCKELIGRAYSVTATTIATEKYFCRLL